MSPSFFAFGLNVSQTIKSQLSPFHLRLTLNVFLLAGEYELDVLPVTVLCWTRGKSLGFEEQFLFLELTLILASAPIAF
jgi:hypothetical protein